MPFTILPHRRFPICCPVTYQTGLFEGQGTVVSVLDGDKINYQVVAKQKSRWGLGRGIEINH